MITIQSSDVMLSAGYGVLVDFVQKSESGARQ